MFDIMVQIVNFIVISVVLKAIVAHWIAERMMKYAKKWFGRTERNTAIFMHYQSRAAGNGHESNDVLACGQGRCNVFA